MAGYSLNDEKALLSAIAGRDAMAFSVLFEGYRAKVYSFSLKYLRSVQLSEEVVQEVFLKVWLLGDRLLSVGDIDSYLLSMARNKSLDYLRRMKLEAVHVSAFSGEEEFADDSTQEGIILRDTRKVIEAGISLLPPQQQLVYRLCHIEGRKQADVAAELGLSPETVKRHMKLALRSLRAHVSSGTDIAVLLLLFRLL